jgi:hypothetical protein
MQGSMHSLAEIPPVKLRAIFNVNVSHESVADLEDTVNLLPYTERSCTYNKDLCDAMIWSTT